MTRGTFQFEADARGDLVASAANVEALRRLWLDRRRINGDDLGPGDPGDFDTGAWHIACHLAGAGGVRRSADGRLQWLEISHDPGPDRYYASVTTTEGDRVTTSAIDSAPGRALLRGSVLLGFVEGTSLGHISARGVQDPRGRFNLWQRQTLDRPADSTEDGGRVWEHWCTLRDIRATQPIATSVLQAYIALAAALGDRFVPTVARGRREYGHPRQLCAMVEAGLTSAAAATWETQPAAIPAPAEHLLNEARPTDALAAVGQLSWGDPPRYYMFARRIGQWSPATAVRADLAAFGGA